MWAGTVVGDPWRNMIGNPVAIVTAAGRGMGAAIASEFHERGYRLALMSSSGGAERLAARFNGLGFTGSVSRSRDVEELVSRTMERYGRIDAVVNNTGHPPKGTLLEIPDEDWHAGLDLVLLNVVRMARAATPIMQAQGGGSIVNISTFAAFEPDPAFPVSSALRAALAGFTKLFADRYAAHNIRMNNVLPGFVDSYPADGETVARIPMGRYGSVTEIARTVAFLASDGAAYITGQNLRVDGGLTRSV